jgi:seryl-tRNA synthetase
MLDITLVRRDPDHVRRAAQRRGGDAAFVDAVLALDEDRRRAQTTADALKAEKGRLSATVAKAADKKAAAAEIRPQLADLDDRIAAALAMMQASEARIAPLLSDVPNLIDPSTPDGGEENNREVRRIGTPRAFDFTPLPHYELGERARTIDFERAAKLSGARFAVLRGAGARLSRAIAAFFLDRAARNGYTEMSVPFLVTRDTMFATGQLSKFADAMFRDDDADLFMIPTAEVPLTAMHRDEILALDELPIRYAAYSACFRKEAGAAGRDTRGLVRLHQFDKVELVMLVPPEDSMDALETMTAHASGLLAELELPHRVVLLAAGDTGFNSAKTYDLEVWLPSQETYREISSCSNCTDFQARRAQIRFRREAQAKPELVHTLNGSGLAVGRTLVAIVENFQEADGSVTLPHALVPFAGFARIDADGSAV